MTLQCKVMGKGQAREVVEMETEAGGGGGVNLQPVQSTLLLHVPSTATTAPSTKRGPTVRRRGRPCLVNILPCLRSIQLHVSAANGPSPLVLAKVYRRGRATPLLTDTVSRAPPAFALYSFHFPALCLGARVPLRCSSPSIPKRGVINRARKN
jgi:hypothetical protein